MSILQYTLVGIVTLIHIYIVILEMVLWTTAKGIATFGLKSKEFAKETKVLAANQGLYNGFIVAGFLWAILSHKTDVALFFLICVFIAGVYGAYSTKKPRIFVVQSIPALIAFISLML